MRFRAKFSQENTILLISVSNLLERVGKAAIFFLTEEFIRIAVVTENSDLPKLFCELKSTNICQEYRIESQSGNSILFEIGITHLSGALLAGKNAPMCQLKLVKRNERPFLCFESRVSMCVSLYPV